MVVHVWLDGFRSGQVEAAKKHLFYRVQQLESVPIINSFLGDLSNIKRIDKREQFITYQNCRTFGQLPDILLKGEGPKPECEGNGEVPSVSTLSKGSLEEFYEEQSIVKEIPLYNSLSVSVKKCPETDKNLVSVETDLPGELGVCRDNNDNWELPAAPRPSNTELFKSKALRTRLQVHNDAACDDGANVETEDENRLDELRVQKPSKEL